MSERRTLGLRGRLSRALVGVSLVSVVLLSAVNYGFARDLIDNSVESQLLAVRDTRVQALEIGMARFQSRVSTMAVNPSVVAALTDLTAAYGQLDEDLSAGQVARLAEIYDAEVLPPFTAAGVDISSTDLVPGSVAGRFVQQHYIAENPNGFDTRDQLDDAGDGSLYSAAHAVHHPLLRSLMENARMSDLLLVDADTNEVVYSTKKQIDIGTDAVNGPYALKGFGEVVKRLSTVAVGETVASDTFFYIPTRGSPVFFLAAAVRSGPEVVGAVVTEVPVELLTAVMTARQDWQLLGLGDTGESYIVGQDGTLRSDSRLWLEDPEEYLRRYVNEYGDQADADLIATVGSAVLLQEVGNGAVTAAQEGDEFVGTVTNYLGTETLAASGPADAAGLGWVVVVEQDKGETDAALNALLRALLVVLLVLLPAIALIGLLLARSLTRPAESLVGAASQIADGDLDTEVEDLGNNELGDLGRQLEGVVRQLESQEQAIIDEERHINDMLIAVLPARLIGRVRDGEQTIEDIFDTATVVSVTVDGMPEAAGVDQDVVLEIADRLNQQADEVMALHGVERVRRSSGSQLFAAGLAQDDAKVVDATRFATRVVQIVADLGAELGHPLSARIGLSAGDVATGVLGTTQVTFGVWGDPASRAVTLGALARPGEVLADMSVVDELGPDWEVGPSVDLPGLAEDIDAHVIAGSVSAGA